MTYIKWATVEYSGQYVAITFVWIDRDHLPRSFESLIYMNPPTSPLWAELQKLTILEFHGGKASTLQMFVVFE